MSSEFEEMWKDFENWSNLEAWNRIQKDYDVNQLMGMISEHKTVYEPKIAKRRIEPKPAQKLGIDIDRLEARLHSLAETIDYVLDDIYLYKRNQDN
jgi:hypothetical protein